MRRAISFIAVVIGLLIVHVRNKSGWIFAHLQSYDTLLQSQFSVTTTIVIRIVQLTLVLLLAGMIVKKYSLPIYSLLLLGVTPILFTSISVIFIPLTTSILLLAAIYWHDVFPVFILAILAAIYLEPQLIVLLPFVMLFFWYKKKLISTGITAVITIILYMWLDIDLDFISPVISELGIGHAPSGFIYLLALVAIFLLWNRQNYVFLLIAGAIATIGLLLPPLAVMGAIISAILAGLTIRELEKREWELENIKNMTLLLLYCGLLFSSVSALAETIRAEPGTELLETIVILEQTAKQNEVYTTVNLQSALEFKGINTTTEYTEILLEERNPEEILKYLPRYSVVHEDEEIGDLRFQFENNPHITLFYDGSYQIWRVR